MLSLNLSDIAVINVKNVHYRCIFYSVGKSEVIHSLRNLHLMTVGIYKIHVSIKDRIFNCSISLIASGKLKTENILIDKKSCKDLVTYFNNYVSIKSIKMLS